MQKKNIVLFLYFSSLCFRCERKKKLYERAQYLCCLLYEKKFFICICKQEQTLLASCLLHFFSATDVDKIWAKNIKLWSTRSLRALNVLVRCLTRVFWTFSSNFRFNPLSGNTILSLYLQTAQSMFIFFVFFSVHILWRVFLFLLSFITKNWQRRSETGYVHSFGADLLYFMIIICGWMSICSSITLCSPVFIIFVHNSIFVLNSKRWSWT